MNRRQKRMLARILVSAALLIVSTLLPLRGGLRLLAALVPYAVIGWDVLWRAARGIVRGQVFDEHFLMSVATIGAFFLGEYTEASGVMLFYQVGELFQSVAVGRARRSIAALMDIRPDEAHAERDGALLTLSPEEVAVGEVIVVRPGEKVPLDGAVIEGESTLDTAALTGESLPRAVAAGDSITGGCVNLTGTLRVRVSRPFAEGTVARILELVENAAARKAKAEQFITRFARWYTPCVVIGAVLLAVVPSLVVGGWAEWVRRALLFLVISCPCALVISIPMSFFGGIGGASRAGILVKGGNYLEALGRLDTVVFDKTGTLTAGVFAVQNVAPAAGVSAQTLLETAALAEIDSPHPIARALRAALPETFDRARVSGVREQAGGGVLAQVDGRAVAVGSARLLEEQGVTVPPCEILGTVVHAAADGRYLGHIEIADQLRPEAAETVRALRGLGVRRLILLTGDRQAAGEKAAADLGLDGAFCQLLPGDKVEKAQLLLDDTPKGKTLAFVGDGVNDAPVLARAHVGIAMGGLGSDAAIEAADVVLMDDRLDGLTRAVRIARRTVAIVRQNIVFALAVKGLCLLLGALGKATMWEAVFADVGVAVIAILNAMRALRPPKDDAQR